VAEPYYADEDVTLYLGDCLAVLPGLPDCSVDAVVTDPPYGLEFMGREWDSFKPSAARVRTRVDGRTNPVEGKSVTATPEAYIAGQPFQRWCEAWAAECLRVLKPGGWLLAFGGTRTSHRLVCGIEDAGFEIRDSTADLTGYDAPGLMWVYGSGFPKSRDVSKAIDKAAGAEREVVGRYKHPDRDDDWSSYPSCSAVKPSKDAYGDFAGRVMDVTAPATEDAARWEGWGTALKPGWEPIAVARKPLAGTVAQNVLAYGTGALNVNGCRVETADNLSGGAHARNGSERHDGAENWRFRIGGAGEYEQPSGRWPPNVVLGEEAAAELDRQSGVLQGGGRLDAAGIKAENKIYGRRPEARNGIWERDIGGASRFFPVFRYEAKAPASERPRLPDGTAHPTVKPVGLMAWLVRLVTPPGGLVLDPFAGSGATAEACIVEGFRCVLIEQDPPSAELIKTRLAKPIQPVMFGLEAG